MANQVTIKQDPSVDGTFLASIFNENGTPVLSGWQEFNIADDMVWDPARYNSPVTPFYIAKGIGPDANNSFVAYAIKVNFDSSVENAVLTVGIAEVPGKDGGSGCKYFTVKGEGVTTEIITNGVPVAGTELPARCA